MSPYKEFDSDFMLLTMYLNTVPRTIYLLTEIEIEVKKKTRTTKININRAIMYIQIGVCIYIYSIYKYLKYS